MHFCTVWRRVAAIECNSVVYCTSECGMRANADLAIQWCRQQQQQQMQRPVLRTRTLAGHQVVSGIIHSGVQPRRADLPRRPSAAASRKWPSRLEVRWPPSCKCKRVGDRSGRRVRASQQAPLAQACGERDFPWPLPPCVSKQFGRIVPLLCTTRKICTRAEAALRSKSGAPAG